MTNLDILLPLRVRRLNDEYVVVEDAAGTKLSCTYIDTDKTRRRSRGSMAPDQAMAVAQVIARSITAHVEGSSRPEVVGEAQD